MGFFSFFIGIILMAIGFSMVYKTDWFRNNFGDVGAPLGVYGASWMSWKVLGIFLLLCGFLTATGLVQLFLHLTIGKLFQLGQLG